MQSWGRQREVEKTKPPTFTGGRPGGGKTKALRRQRLVLEANRSIERLAITQEAVVAVFASDLNFPLLNTLNEARRIMRALVEEIDVKPPEGSDKK